jgi:hypothetical protein
MSTLKEQRMISAHQWGRRDYRANLPMIIPAFLKDLGEREAYRAGWLGEQLRDQHKEAVQS